MWLAAVCIARVPAPVFVKFRFPERRAELPLMERVLPVETSKTDPFAVTEMFPERMAFPARVPPATVMFEERLLAVWSIPEFRVIGPVNEAVFDPEAKINAPVPFFVILELPERALDIVMFWVVLTVLLPWMFREWILEFPPSVAPDNASVWPKLLLKMIPPAVALAVPV